MTQHKFKKGKPGLASAYARGCRCAECREAWRVYRRPKEHGLNGRRARAKARRRAETPVRG